LAFQKSDLAGALHDETEAIGRALIGQAYFPAEQALDARDDYLHLHLVLFFPNLIEAIAAGHAQRQDPRILQSGVREQWFDGSRVGSANLHEALARACVRARAVYTRAICLR